MEMSEVEETTHHCYLLTCNVIYPSLPWKVAIKDRNNSYNLWFCVCWHL